MVRPTGALGTLIRSPPNTDDEASDSEPADGLPRLKHVLKVARVSNLSIFLDYNHSFSFVCHIIFLFLGPGVWPPPAVYFPQRLPSQGTIRIFI